MLAGRQDRHDEVSELHELANVADIPHWRWEFDPQEQRDLWVSLDERFMRPWIIYHSHLEHGPELSPTDVAMAAADPSIVHLVLSVRTGQARLWRVDAHKQVMEVPFTLFSDGSHVDLTGHLTSGRLTG